MSDYQNFTDQVVNLGLNLRDIPDRLEAGKWRRLTNVRSDEEGALTSRPGRAEVAHGSEQGRVHTLTKLDDAFIYGIGTVMYRNNTAYATVWSSLPKTTVRHKASRGDDKWLYISDGYQSKMLHVDGTEYGWGLDKPQVPITATVDTAPGGLNSSGVNVYDWRYTFYSTRTGAESNPCKEMPTGLAVTNKSVFLICGGSLDVQVDKIKIYRRGGALGQLGWKHVATVNNPSGGGTVRYLDSMSDEELQTKDELLFDNDRPFTSVVESSVKGEPDLELDGTPMPYIFGPFIGKYIFGCGDVNRPNHLYWTNPGRPTSAGALNHVAVTAPEEPLLGGFIYGGLPYVYTREGFYAVDYQGDDQIPVFTTRRLPIGRGVSAPYCVAVGPTVFFLAKDGVYMGDMQGAGEPLTEASIRRVFLPEQTTYDATFQGVEQIDWGTYAIQPPGAREESVLDTVRLVFGGKYLRLFYKAANSTWVHLVNDTPYDRWSNDYLATDAADPEWECIAFYDEEQPNTSWIVGTTKGRILREEGLTDDGNAIQCRVRSRSYDFDMPQTLKEFGNIIVDADVNGSNVPLAVDPLYPSGMAVTPYYNAETSSGSYQRINGTGRQKFPLSLSDTYVYSLAIDVEWNGNGRLYQWDILWRMDEEWLTHWEFPPTTFGAKGWTHMRDFYVTLRSTGSVTAEVVVDGVSYSPAIAGGTAGIIPSTSGEKRKLHLWMPPVKGKLYQVKLDGGPFRLYGEDSEMRVKEWATGLSYPIVNPFQQEGGGS